MSHKNYPISNRHGPQCGVDEVFIEKIPVYVNDHAELTNREEPDQHPISAITGLEEELSKRPAVASVSSISAGEIAVFSSEGLLDCCGHTVSDFVLKEEIPDITPVTKYTHVQEVASSTWEISHNLDAYPTVIIVDDEGSTVYSDVIYVDSNNITIKFTEEFSGKVYLN